MSKKRHTPEQIIRKLREAVDPVREQLRVSEGRACQVLEQPRSAQRRQRKVPGDEPTLVARIVELAKEFGRYGYRLWLNDGSCVRHRPARDERGRTGSTHSTVLHTRRARLLPK